MLVSADSPIVLPPIDAIDRRIDRSDAAWREWSGNLVTDGPYANHVRRSALSLKLLVFSPTGSVAAAATTSCPSGSVATRITTIGMHGCATSRIRSKHFLRVGATEEAAAAFHWLIETIRRNDGRLCTMYRLDGSLAPEEEELDVPGYAESRPSAAETKREISYSSEFSETSSKPPRFSSMKGTSSISRRARCSGIGRPLCRSLAQTRRRHWELEKQEHYTISKIGCWTALDRAVALADKGQIDSNHKERWARERDRMRDWIDAECWSESKQSYTLHPGTDRLDASLLLATRFGFERSDRLALTRDAVRRELARGSLVYRYSGMEAEEGTFVACGFGWSKPLRCSVTFRRPSGKWTGCSPHALRISGS